MEIIILTMCLGGLGFILWKLAQLDTRMLSLTEKIQTNERRNKKEFKTQEASLKRENYEVLKATLIFYVSNYRKGMEGDADFKDIKDKMERAILDLESIGEFGKQTDDYTFDEIVNRNKDVKLLFDKSQ